MSIQPLDAGDLCLAELKTKPDEKPKQPKQQIDDLQLALLRLQHGLFLERKRVMIVIEGTDTAGKGGIIRRLVRHMDPRGIRVWPIGPPADWEQSRHHLYRFWKRVPEPGDIAVFDRSWYGRVLVERIEGHANAKEWRRAYRELKEFERQLTDDGVIIIKIFLHLSKQEQYQRFVARINEPTKRWKITLADLESRRYWDEYQQAYEDMLKKTNTAYAPWYVVPADDKQYARVESLRLIEETLAAHVDTKRVSLLDPAVLKVAQQYIDKEDLSEDLSEGLWKNQ